jgi:hypothetical protein
MNPPQVVACAAEKNSAGKFHINTAFALSAVAQNSAAQRCFPARAILFFEFPISSALS